MINANMTTRYLALLTSYQKFKDTFTKHPVSVLHVLQTVTRCCNGYKTCS